MHTIEKREKFDHYRETQSSFNHTPVFTDFSAGFDAGMAHIQNETDVLKRQIVTLRYAPKPPEGVDSRIATLESLNRALILALAEMNGENL
ncbi:MAG: hypothetical protein R8K48_06290 [Gallionella sp.]